MLSSSVNLLLQQTCRENVVVEMKRLGRDSDLAINRRPHIVGLMIARSQLWSTRYCERTWRPASHANYLNIPIITHPIYSGSERTIVDGQLPRRKAI